MSEYRPFSGRAREVFNDGLGRYLANQERGLQFIEYRLATLCDSEIERMLAAALCFTSISYYEPLPVLWEKTEYVRRKWHRDDEIVKDGFDDKMLMVPQCPIGPIHVDFGLIFVDCSEVLRIAVECDGHDFHEKTKHQAQRDKRRDRGVQSEGWRIFRFTGSEIYRDPFACLQEISAFVDKWHGDVFHRLVSRGK